MKLEVLLFLTTIPLVQMERGHLDKYCQSSVDCGSYGYFCAQNRTCQCESWFIPNRARQKCLGAVGQRCKYDEHCIDGAFCEYQSRCKCKEDYFALDDGTICSGSTRHFTSNLLILVIFTILML